MADFILCSIPDCDKRSYEKGWCTKHYKRWHSHGDPLKTLKTPHGEVQSFYKDVVLNHDANECLLWPYAKTNGYGVLGNSRVSVMVCQATHGAKPTKQHQAAHSCGNASCVAKAHISWKTPVENNKDKVGHGTLRRGEANGSVINADDVLQIRALRDYLSRNDIAVIFGIKRATVNNIFNGSCWGWLP